jgi:hypothetical protein
MKPNADDPHQFDFHPWPRPLRSGNLSRARPGQRSPGRMVLGTVILAILVLDATLSDLSFGRWIVTGIIAYVVIIWMTRRHPQGPAGR